MSDAIDAQVVLALATKAAQVFAQNGTYLSIPLSPLAYRSDAISAIQDQTPEGARMEAELSCLVNRIPDGPIWGPVGERYLWDVYGDVLANAELASTKRTAKQEKKYRAALAVLTVKGPDGRRVESPKVVAYRACRDAWLTAQQEYNNEKGHVELSGDAAAKAQWEAVDEPALRLHVEDAREKWATEGHRAKVDDARAVVRRLGDRSARSTWQTYLERFDPEMPAIYYRSDAELGQYVPTGLRPSAFVDRDWYRITLEAAELATLAGEAPAELRQRFPSNGGSGIGTLSFEYTSVGVSRGWMAPEVFESRAWRLAVGEPPLSDGAAEPQGRCTAYVAGLVLARNVTVTPNPPPATPPTTSPGTPIVPLRAFHLGFVNLEKPRLLAGENVLVARPLVRDPELLRDVRDHRRDLRMAPLRPMDPGDRADLPRPRPRPVALPPREPRPVLEPEPQPQPQPQPEPQPQPSTPVTTPEGELYVLGFICKRLRRCPDPDPALQW